MLLPPDTFRRHWMSYVEVLEGKRQTPATRSMLLVFSILSLFLVLVTGFYLLGVIIPTYQVTSRWFALFFLSGVFPKKLRTDFTLTLFVYVFCAFVGVSFELIQSRKQIQAFMAIFSTKERQKFSKANQQKFESIVNLCFRFINWDLNLQQMMTFLFYLACCFMLSDAWWIDKRLCLIWTFLGLSINLCGVNGGYHHCFWSKNLNYLI